MVPKFEEAGDDVADDGGAEVADVHLFGDVGAGEIDDGDGGIGEGVDAEAVGIAEGFGEAVGEPVGAEAEVDKAGAGDLGRFAEVGDIEIIDDLLGQGAGVLF